MSTARWLIVVSALVGLASGSASAGKWYPGLIHLHTQFSDGVSSPAALAADARAAGMQFIVVTDHYDMIGEIAKGGTAFSVALGGQPGSDAVAQPWGFDRYCQEVSALTKEGEFVAIPGAEIGARWEPEPGNEASAHTLALGVIREADSQVMDEYCEQPDRQQDVINKILQWGMLPIAAHPSFLHDGSLGRLSYTGRIDYRYDKRPEDQVPEIQYRGLAGVEVFNTDGSGQTQEDIDFYLRLLREGYAPFVTSGCDYHGYNPFEADWLKRVTWVHTESLTTEGILEGLRQGRTYAADFGAELISMSPMPGDHVEMDRPVIRAAVRFPSPTGSPKQFMVYRDGVLTAGPFEQPAGRTEYDFSWTDDTATPGEHSYVLRIGEVLITSPARVAASQPALFADAPAGTWNELQNHRMPGAEVEGPFSGNSVVSRYECAAAWNDLVTGVPEEAFSVAPPAWGLMSVNAPRSDGVRVQDTVPFEHWAFDAIERLATLGILNGDPDGTFSGDRSMTREEFVGLVHNTYLWLAEAGLTFLGESSPAPDLLWAKAPFNTARQMHLTDDLPEFASEPQHALTRSEFATIVARVARDWGLDDSMVLVNLNAEPPPLTPQSPPRTRILLCAEWGYTSDVWRVDYSPCANMPRNDIIFRNPGCRMLGMSVAGDGTRIALAMGEEGLWLLDSAGALVETIDITQKFTGADGRSMLGTDVTVMDVSFGPFSDRLALCLGEPGGEAGWLADYSIPSGELVIISPECPGPAAGWHAPHEVERKLRYANASISSDGRSLAYSYGREVYCAEYPSLRNPQLLTSNVNRPPGTGQMPPNGTYGCSKLAWRPGTQQVAALLEVEGGDKPWVLHLMEAGTPAHPLGSFYQWYCPTWYGPNSLVVGEDGQGRTHYWDFAENNQPRYIGTTEIQRDIPLSLMIGADIVPAAITTASLTVRSVGGPCKIYLDGGFTGQATPSTFVLKPGAYKIEIRDALGQTAGAEVLIKPGETKDVVLDPNGSKGEAERRFNELLRSLKPR